MKQHILTFVCILLAAGLFAQAPQGLNYQAVARNANGDPIPNQSVTINFKIHHGSANGNVVFEETQNSTTDACGLFNLKIGEANAAAFNNINWSTGSKFLEVKINGSLVGTTEMLSVPYALYAEKANLQGTAGGDLNGSYPNPSVDAIQNVPVAATAPQQGQVMMYDNGSWKPMTFQPYNTQINLQQNVAYSVASTIRGASWNDVKLSDVIPTTQIQTPSTGTYLILANLKVTNTAPSDEEFQFRVLLVNTNGELLTESTVFQKSSSTVAIEKGELSSWTIAQLTQGDLIKLQQRMVVGNNNEPPFSYTHGKLALIKLQ